MLCGIVCLVVTLGGCSRSLDRGDLIDAYVRDNPGATAVEADCVIDRLLSDRSIAQIEQELGRATPSVGFARDRYRADFDCGRTDDVRHQLEQLIAARGTDPADADCIATELTRSLTDPDLDVLFDGQMTDAFFDKYYLAVSACDALPG
jgi:hypothetical protein